MIISNSFSNLRFARRYSKKSIGKTFREKYVDNQDIWWNLKLPKIKLDGKSLRMGKRPGRIFEILKPCIKIGFPDN